MARKPTKKTEQKEDVLVERPSKNPRGIEYDREISNVSASDAAKIVAELTPFVGDVMAAKEIFEETQKEDPNWFMIGALGGAAVVGLIPGIGDAASAMIKRGAKASSRKSASLLDEAPKAISRSDLDASIGRSGRKMYDEEDVLEADDLIFSWEKGEISNPELRKRMKDIGFPVDTKRIMPKKTGEELEVVNPNNNKIQQWRDVPMGFSEGGDVSRQMDAVLKSTRVDPVSGNEVPPGSLPEEVRDDVPAMLSEGEYVVPADVLRYYGVKFFEDLRDNAKQEMMGLEANGRTGQPIDEDMPFSMEELNVIDDGEEDMPMEGMSKGGYVKGYAEGGVTYNPNVANMNVPDFLQGVVAPGQSVNEDYKTFKNDAGMIMTVRFINGKPTAYIPPGYIETIAGVTTPTAAPAPAIKPAASSTRDPNDYGGPDEQGKPGRDYSKSSTEDLEAELEGLKSGTSFGSKVNSVLQGTLIGMISKAVTGKSLNEQAIEAIENELSSRNNTTTSSNTTAATSPASSAVSNAVQNAVDSAVASYGATQGTGATLDTATDLAMDMLGLSSAKGINANRDISRAIAEDMNALAATGSTFGSSRGRGYANPSSTSANLTGIMGLGTDQSQPGAASGIGLDAFGGKGPAIGGVTGPSSSSMSGAMSAALGGFGTSKGGEFGGTPSAGDGRGGYGGLAGDYGGYGGGNSGPSGNFGGGDGGMSGAASAAAGGFGGSPGGEFGGAGGYGGGDAGTGSDNNGDGFGDMGGISGGWNKGGLVQKPKRKRKK